MATMRRPAVMPRLAVMPRPPMGEGTMLPLEPTPQPPPSQASPLTGGIDQYFNQGRIDQRVNSARDHLERFGKSRMASNRANLASRGTLGSGPEITAMNRSEEAIGDMFANAINDIYSDESGRADQLGLGMAGLGLQRDLGMGRLSLDQDELVGRLGQGQTSQLLQILQMLQGGAAQSAGGFV